jgi:hypothetical protein
MLKVAIDFNEKTDRRAAAGVPADRAFAETQR